MSIQIERLWSDLEFLASCPRPAQSDRLEVCRDYVRSELAACGWRSNDQPFQAQSEDGRAWQGVNLVAEHHRHPLEKRPRLCVGAHLDSRPDTPGADDNASAVATLLEIARLFDTEEFNDPQLALELVAFDLEECGMLGGAAHARRLREAGVELRGMVSLEMLGYCDHAPDSQQLPRTLVGLYPDTGNFIAVIGNQNSTRLIDGFAGGMRQVDGLPVETLQVEQNGELLQATRLSDHSPFWDQGFAALMITDTSFMRNPHYHTPTDTPDTLDREFLEAVAEGCWQAVKRLIVEGLDPDTL